MAITPNYDLDVDTSLGGNSASDYVIPSQKAIKSYVDNNSGTSIPPIAYGTSITAASTAEKVVSIPEITELNSGQIIVVSPTKSATVGNLTIKLNNFDAYPILYAGAAITTSTDSVVWNANQPSAFIFNGTNWLFLCHGLDSNTTYSTMPVLEGVTGTATNNRTLQAANLKQIIQETTLTDLSIATASTVLATDSITDGIGKLQAQINALPSIPTNISAFTNDSGYITGITSSMVTTALGYTPYNSTNPSGYQANVIETIKVNNVAQTVTSKAVNITVPSAVTESTVSGWGFTKNVGTVTSVNNVSPVNGNVSITIPTVNNATLTIQKNGTTVNTFTANASSNVTANITVPTTAAEVNAADTDLSNLSASGKTVIDGDWVYSYTQLQSGVSPKASTPLPISLSSYLPNDNYKYEVIIGCALTSGTSVSALNNCIISSDIITEGIRVCQVVCQVANKTNSNAASITLPVGSGRSLSMARNNNWTGSTSIFVYGYRRIGTNT